MNKSDDLQIDQHHHNPENSDQLSNMHYDLQQNMVPIKKQPKKNNLRINQLNLDLVNRLKESENSQQQAQKTTVPNIYTQSASYNQTQNQNQTQIQTQTSQLNIQNQQQSNRSSQPFQSNRSNQPLYSQRSSTSYRGILSNRNLIKLEQQKENKTNSRFSIFQVQDFQFDLEEFNRKQDLLEVNFMKMYKNSNLQRYYKLQRKFLLVLYMCVGLMIYQCQIFNPSTKFMITIQLIIVDFFYQVTIQKKQEFLKIMVFITNQISVSYFFFSENDGCIYFQMFLTLSIVVHDSLEYYYHKYKIDQQKKQIFQKNKKFSLVIKVLTQTLILLQVIGASFYLLTQYIYFMKITVALLLVMFLLQLLKIAIRINQRRIIFSFLQNQNLDLSFLIVFKIKILYEIQILFLIKLLVFFLVYVENVNLKGGNKQSRLNFQYIHQKKDYSNQYQSVIHLFLMFNGLMLIFIFCLKQGIKNYYFLENLNNYRYVQEIDLQNKQKINIKTKKIEQDDFPLYVIKESDTLFSIQNVNQKKKIVDDEQIETDRNLNKNLKGNDDNNNSPINYNLASNINSSQVDSCLICYDQRPNSVFLNCGHGGICYDCSMDIWKQKKQCYLCRKQILQVVKIDDDNLEQNMKQIKLISQMKDINNQTILEEMKNDFTISIIEDSYDQKANISL